MYKNSMGILQLLPVKDEGKFVFLNNELRMNGKLSKGDCIKLLVEDYKIDGDRHLLTQTSNPQCRLIIRGEKKEFRIETPCVSVEELYDRATDFYKQQFYFGKN